MWSRSWTWCLVIGLLLAGCPGDPVPGAQSAPGEALQVLIDTRRTALYLMKGGEIIRGFHGISIGRGGTTQYRVRGDNKTPLGTFRVAWIDSHSRFHRFFGLDYPHLRHALWGLSKGLIDVNTYNAIYRSLRNREIPPQHTMLGGFIGIHGLGQGDPDVHESLHWTNGCVALTNEQVEELEIWISVGTKVIIR